MQIKHSVIIITYNQEKLIGRAIDSLLLQRDYVFEIIVADDCSTDNNWEVIKSYQTRFPNLIKAYRNEQNLGIFANIETTWDKAKGNVIWNLSGDDEYCNGVFEKASELIVKNNFDPEEEYFTIYFDFKRIYPSGMGKVHSNSKILKYNPISLKLRNLIYGRTIGVSKSVYNSYFPIKKGLGIMSDGLQDIQVQLFTHKSVYYPMVGSIYYTNIGIGSKTEHNEALKSFLCCIPEYLRIIPDIKDGDVLWLNFLEKRYKCEIEPNYTNLISSMKCYLKSFELKFGLTHTVKQFAVLIYLLFLFIKNKLEKV